VELKTYPLMGITRRVQDKKIRASLDIVNLSRGNRIPGNLRRIDLELGGVENERKWVAEKAGAVGKQGEGKVRAREKVTAGLCFLTISVYQKSIEGNRPK